MVDSKTVKTIFEIAGLMAAIEMKLKELEKVLSKDEMKKLKEELKARLRAKL